MVFAGDLAPLGEELFHKGACRLEVTGRVEVANDIQG
jgi:hypothetical protein